MLPEIETSYNDYVVAQRVLNEVAPCAPMSDSPSLCDISERGGRMGASERGCRALAALFGCYHYEIDSASIHNYTRSSMEWPLTNNLSIIINGGVDECLNVWLCRSCADCDEALDDIPLPLMSRTLFFETLLENDWLGDAYCDQCLARMRAEDAKVERMISVDAA